MLAKLGLIPQGGAESIHWGMLRVIANVTGAFTVIIGPSYFTLLRTTHQAKCQQMAENW